MRYDCGMNTRLDMSLAREYRSPSQRIRVVTEAWVGSNVYCASCGHGLASYEANRPVADFNCPSCNEEYELKSKKGALGKKVVDGTHATMLTRLQSANNPSLFLLAYQPATFEVRNFFVVPSHFFVADIIERRPALPPSARRAGWVGCNIILEGIPASGRIFYVQEGRIQSRESVVKNWGKTTFLRETGEPAARTWLVDTMNCLDRIGKTDFTLDEVYAFADGLGKKHPNNHHIKDKLRQQLQVLRDKGYLEFSGRGRYRLTGAVG